MEGIPPYWGLPRTLSRIFDRLANCSTYRVPAPTDVSLWLPLPEA